MLPECWTSDDESCVGNKYMNVAAGISEELPTIPSQLYRSQHDAVTNTHTYTPTPTHTYTYAHLHLHAPTPTRTYTHTYLLFVIGWRERIITPPFIAFNLLVIFVQSLVVYLQG